MKTSTAVRSSRISPGAAAALLSERDPVIARLAQDFGPPSFPRPVDSHFATLVRSVTYQQLAGAAARAIHGRVIGALGGEVRARSATSNDLLRSAGLSTNKVLSIQDLSMRVIDGTVVLDPRRLARQNDAEVTDRLTTVRGIGKWSADMFLLHQLRRLDVWPTGDLAVRRDSHSHGVSLCQRRSRWMLWVSLIVPTAASSPGIAGEQTKSDPWRVWSPPGSTPVDRFKDERA